MPRTKETNNTSGSVFKNQIVRNGRKIWVWDVRKRYKDAAGKERDKTKRCYSASEADNALLNIQNEINAIRAAASAPKMLENILFSDLAAYFSKHHVKKAVFSGGRKIAGYKKNLTNIESILKDLNEHFGSIPVREIKYADIRRFYEAIAVRPTNRGTPPAIATINERLSFLRRVLNVAIQMEWLDVNPFTKGDSIIDRASEGRRNRMLTFEEESLLLAALEPHQMTYEYKRWKKFSNKKTEETITAKCFVDRSRLKPIVICALDTAMRVGEVFNLERWQIDFTKNVIYLNKEAARATKTGTEGILPMSSRLREILLPNVKNKSPNDKIFAKFDYKRSFKSACLEAGLENLQMRDFRSSGATRMVLAGNSESQVMKVTRHRNLKIFLEHYTNVDVANAQRIGNSLDNFIAAEKARISTESEKATPLKGDKKGEE